MPLVLNAPALPNQVWQGFWRRADAGVAPGGSHAERIQVPPHASLAIALDRVRDDLHDPVASRPVVLDVLRSLFGP